MLEPLRQPSAHIKLLGLSFLECTKIRRSLAKNWALDCTPDDIGMDVVIRPGLLAAVRAKPPKVGGVIRGYFTAFCLVASIGMTDDELVTRGYSHLGLLLVEPSGLLGIAC